MRLLDHMMTKRILSLSLMQAYDIYLSKRKYLLIQHLDRKIQNSSKKNKHNICNFEK